VSVLSQRNRLSALTTSLAGLIAVVAAWIAADNPLSAVLGAVLVLVFFSAGTLPFLIAGDGTGGRGRLAFLVLGMTYVLRILLGVIVYQVASRTAGVDFQVVGLTIIGCALVWTNTQLVSGLQRKNQPTLDL
jgi:hypothetical protein